LRSHNNCRERVTKVGRFFNFAAGTSHTWLADSIARARNRQSRRCCAKHCCADTVYKQKRVFDWGETKYKLAVNILAEEQ
jgi:hypothetical protein